MIKKYPYATTSSTNFTIKNVKLRNFQFKSFFGNSQAVVALLAISGRQLNFRSIFPKPLKCLDYFTSMISDPVKSKVFSLQNRLCIPLWALNTMCILLLQFCTYVYIPTILKKPKKFKFSSEMFSRYYIYVSMEILQQKIIILENFHQKMSL